MTRLNLVLLLAVLFSALYLVRTQYESRRLFTEIEKANNEARRHETERERLQVEKRAQATPLRVEKLAKDQLHMRAASPAITQYVTLHDSGTQAARNADASTGAAAPATGAGVSR